MKKQLDLHLEPLEQRQMLSGNVRVRLTNQGDLHIIGDGRNNRVLILADDVNNQFTIASGESGMPSRFDTKINGQLGPVVIDHGALRDLRINMKGGLDAVVFAVPSSTQRTFRHGFIMGGGGNDGIAMGLGDGRMTFTGNLRIALGGGIPNLTPLGLFGDQAVVLNHTDVQGDLTVIGNRTNDFVALNADSGQPNTIGGQSTFRLGAGWDLMSIDGWTLDGPLEVNLGSGFDDLDLEEVTANGPVHIDLGTGDDDLRIENVTANDLFVANAAVGFDTVETTHSQFPNFPPELNDFEDEVVVP